MTELNVSGFAIADISLTREQCDYIALSLPIVEGGRGGIRNLISHPTVLQVLMHEQLGRYLWSVVGRELVAVRATLFDKTADSNWRVQWHQDRTITVKERMDVAGYGPWTTKVGVLHVEPPASVLAQMLAVRIHLDECGPDNGLLRVISGSHEGGKLSEQQLQSSLLDSTATDLRVPKGGIVLMRPLLVHASVPARVPAHRRVLHIEFAPVEAISPLKWETIVHLRRAA